MNTGEQRDLFESGTLGAAAGRVPAMGGASATTALSGPPRAGAEGSEEGRREERGEGPTAKTQRTQGRTVRFLRKWATDVGTGGRCFSGRYRALLAISTQGFVTSSGLCSLVPGMTAGKARGWMNGLLADYGIEAAADSIGERTIWRLGPAGRWRVKRIVERADRWNR